METDANSKRQRRTNKPLTVFPKLLENNAGRIAWVQVQRNIELCKSFPEDIPLRLVVEDVIFAISSGSLSVVHQCALEAILRNCSSKLICGFLGIVHGECSAIR